MKPGIATIALRKYDILHAIDIAAEAGFLGIEVWGKPPHIPEPVDQDHLLAIRDRIRGYELEVSMLGSYVNPSLVDFEARADRAIDTAKVLGTRIIRVWAGDREPHEANEENWTDIIRAMREFALRAEYHGLTLAMEMHSGTLCATPEGALRVIEQSGSPNLKLNFQVVNFANADIENLVSMVGRHSVNVHAQNFQPSGVEEGKMERSLIQEGVVDYERVLSLLSKQGFDGFVEVEFVKDEGLSESAMMDALKKDARYLRMLTARHAS